MSTVRIIAVPFKVLSRENITEYVLCCLLNWYLLEVKTYLSHATPFKQDSGTF